MKTTQKLNYKDCISNCKRLTESDKVRKNSSDDYGLGAGWYFHYGQWKNGKWVVWYIEPSEDILEIAKSHLLSGIGSIQYIPRHERNDCAAIVISDQYMIGQVIVDLNDINEEFENFNN